MWHWSRKSAQLLIGRDQITLRQPYETSGAIDSVKFPVSGSAALADAMACCLAEAPRANLAVDIVVSDAYARFWIVVPPKNASTRGDLRLCALWRFEELFGEPPDAWNLQANWQAARPFMASAVPLALTDSIRSVVSSRRISVKRCVPRFVAEWNMHCRRLSDRHTWFGVSSDSTTTVALVQDGQIATVRNMRQHMGQELQAVSLASSLRAIALQHQTCSSEKVLLCGEKPATWEASSIEGFTFEWVKSTTPGTRSTEFPGMTQPEAPR